MLFSKNKNYVCGLIFRSPCSTKVSEQKQPKKKNRSNKIESNKVCEQILRENNRKPV